MVSSAILLGGDEQPLQMPSSIPSKAADLIKKLLVQDPKKRLGADAKGMRAVKGAPARGYVLTAAPADQLSFGGDGSPAL